MSAILRRRYTNSERVTRPLPSPRPAAPRHATPRLARPVCVFGVRISVRISTRDARTWPCFARAATNLHTMTSLRNVLPPRSCSHSPGRQRISLFPRVDSEDRVLAEGDVGRGSVSGSLDPFKPFHRRFTRLHNAATLIKINYTLARRSALLSLSPSLPAPARPGAGPAHHPSSTRPPPPPPAPPPPFTPPAFFALAPCRFFAPHFRPPRPGNALPLSPPWSFICTLFEI